MRDSQTRHNNEEGAALPQDENRYRQLLNKMINAYALHEIICDEQGKPIDYRFLDVNLAFEQMTGFKAESIVGHTVLEILPQTEPSWIEIYGKVALTGEPVHFEDFSRELNRYYKVIAFRPAPNQFACTFTDITNRKESELALIAAKKEIEAGKEYLENIINNIGDPIFVKDDQSQLLLVNDSFCTLFDLSREQIIGKTLTENVPPDEMEHFLRVDKQVLTDGRENITEEKLTVRGKPTRTILTRKSRVIDSQNNKHLIGIIRDISNRKEAELALAAEKERLAVTLRSIGDGVITTDTDGNIVMLNQVAEELTGWDSTEAIGRPLPEVFNIINERTRQPCENPVERVLASNEVVELANNTSLLTKDGREIIIADSGAPIRDNEGQIIGVVLVFRDMTEKQKLEDYMQKSQKLESLGVLAGGIAHDFNNLLGAIFGYTEIAISKSNDKKVTKFLKKSVQTIDRARALTEQLLTFAKGGEPVRIITDLFPFVQETVQFALSGSSVSAKVQTQENLWPCHIDKNQIGQVIDNLTINAQQAMPNGGVIEVSAQNVSLSKNEHVTLPAGNYVKLSIRDKGIGIPKNHLPTIFDPYFTTKTKGHGLGLATCYSIIYRHEGCIDVESELGEGSTFHVYLPASVESISDTEKASTGEHRGSGSFLVMDDEEVICEVLKEILESYGYTVVIKNTGEEAVEFCVAETRANRKLTGMIFDLTVPGGMGGKEAITKIRKMYPDTPAFVTSGYSEDPIIAHPQEHGFNASLRKPFTINELSDMLETHMGKR